jgi:MFS family permease
MVSSVLPIYLLVHLQLTPLQLGLVDGLYQGVNAAVRLIGGYVADRWQRYKAVAAAGYFISAICKLGLLAAGAVPSAVAAVISIDRTGKGLRTAPRDAMISLSAKGGDLGAAFGAHRALDTVGVVVGPLLAYLVLKAAPGAFDAVFVLSFAVAVVGLGVMLFFVQDTRGEKAEVEVTSLHQMLALRSNQPFVSVVFAATLLGVTVMSDAFLYLMLQRQAGLDAETLPLLFVGAACAFLVLAMPVGRLADRLGRARVFIGGHLVVMGIYAAALFFPLNLAGVILCLALHGAYYAATDGVLPALASTMLPASVRTSGLAAIGTASSLARLVGSVLLGALWTWWGPSAVLGFGLASTAAVLMWAAVRMPRAEARVATEGAP